MAAVAVPTAALRVPSVSTAESTRANEAAPASQVMLALGTFRKFHRL